jgi:hypothetical protein
MNDRRRVAAGIAATHHGVVSTTQLDALGVGASTRSRRVSSGLLKRIGTRSYEFLGTPETWMTRVAAAEADLDGVGVVGGRTAGKLLGLDGFDTERAEMIVLRRHRHRRCSGLVHSTGRAFQPGDIVRIEGLRVTSAQRTILDSPIFGFSREETENAIDSAIRLRLVPEQRLRTRVIAEHGRGVNGGRCLVDALVDTGGESRLERRFLALIRQRGIDRPMTQKVFRSDGRTIARVDAFFPGGLVVEVSGHGTHATRLQRQIDAQRQTELTVRGLRVVTFTFEDVTYRPDWVAARVLEALRCAA